ncbi:nudix hydrolase 2-like isoform X2 [Rhododendron vialii]|uniref:nudix hydrolase 2-like isoform X2 n=1 Tax=Rhododendron vialii TaxID=182163 RepID=UPI0026604D65|nr:nudix hydrolase 2-like isoform X2 [Rhododendron vialii]XP_058209141.1 nudix hydrolase 2-like isoform X2 [Rhododendron vialii]XP_058209143.1 nudix hydrolase 2-like isoform X2 [Rhododendron vialii]
MCSVFMDQIQRLFLADKILVFRRACSELSGYKQGFRYHYAKPSYLMLAKWIAETFDTLPANASHRVGIGAFVMNDMGEVLVVQENSGTFTGTGVWKFPTGIVDEHVVLGLESSVCNGSWRVN